MSERIEKITQAVQDRFGKESYHVDQVRVLLGQGKFVDFDGQVEVFHIPKTKGSVRCYAWEYVREDDPEYVTVIAIMRKDAPEPMTAEQAVMLWLPHRDDPAPDKGPQSS